MMGTGPHVSHRNKLVHMVAGQGSKTASGRSQGLLKPVIRSGTKSPPSNSVGNAIHRVSPDSRGGELDKTSGWK